MTKACTEDARLGSFVANTPPSRWKDANEVTFGEKLDALIQKFRRVEKVSFAANRHRAAPPSVSMPMSLSLHQGPNRCGQQRLKRADALLGLTTPIIRWLAARQTSELARAIVLDE